MLFCGVFVGLFWLEQKEGGLPADEESAKALKGKMFLQDFWSFLCGRRESREIGEAEADPRKEGER